MSLQDLLAWQPITKSKKMLDQDEILNELQDFEDETYCIMCDGSGLGRRFDAGSCNMCNGSGLAKFYTNCF